MKQLLYGFLTLLFISLITTNNITAQTATASIENVRSIRLRSSGIIKDNDGVKGYFYFYKKEKADRKNHTFILDILDENLNSVARKEITASKALILQSSTYNGEVIMLKFYDHKSRTLQFHSFTKEGELLNKKEVPVKNQYQTSTYKVSDKDETKPETMHVVGKRGFVDYSMVKNKRFGYKMSFIPTDGKSKEWTYTSPEDVKNTLAGNFLYADDEVLLSAILDRPKLMTNKGLTYHIASNDMETGKLLWQTTLKSPKYEISLLNSYADKESNRVVLFGSYFEKGANMAKAKSLGLFSFVMDVQTGKLVKENYISWVDDAGKFLPIKDNGKIKSVGYVFFHQFVKTADGRIFAVGEQYRKSISALGMMSDDAAAIKMVIEDFYIFEFNEDFSLKNIKVFEKGKSNILLPSGAGIYSAARIANYLKMEGAFDFYYVQTDDGGEVMHICYLDYDRQEKGQRKKSYFGTITYVDGEFSQDKIVLERKWLNAIMVLPAKAGHTLIMEYNWKEKALNLRLEPINF